MRFFLKLFVSFLLTVLLAGVVLFWSGHHLRAEMDEQLRQRAYQLLQERQELAALLTTQGVEAVRQRLRAFLRVDDLLILDEANQDLLGRPISDGLRERLEGNSDATSHHHHARHLFFDGPDGHDRRPNGPSLHHPLLAHDADNHAYKLVILPAPSLWKRILWEYPLLPLGVVLVSALVVFVLARHFTRPIRRLRSMALAMASGDLSTRALVARGRLPDELNDLERDFNFMAQQLEELFRAQHRLLRDVSHELRSPLARMRVALGLMEQSLTGSDDNLNRMTLELERLDELIGQIIAISRPSMPGGVRRDVLVDLGEMVRIVVADARFEMEQQERLRIQEQVDTTALLWADAAGLRSVVDNVLRNALHHSGQQGTVWVELVRQGNMARLVISDQGPGVPEGDLSRIFLPFYRVEESRERKSGCFGLGLAIAARVVREHGGQIVARNRSEGGLEVTILLPLEPEQPEDHGIQSV
ncbi:MAG: HAMP domain-containing protein [Magnetococcales bacterium]|nr:HAMP domain-containing protein [Magnetococcales bacterium]